MLVTGNIFMQLIWRAPITASSKFDRFNLWKLSYASKVSRTFAKSNNGSNGINSSAIPIEVEMERKHKREDSYDEGFNIEEVGDNEQQEEGAYDRDPEFADILGSFLCDPPTGQSKLEERMRKKRHKILHSKTGSSAPVKVTFNSFDFSNSLIWLEFYNSPIKKDIRLICDAIRSWHIIGRLGGCNSMNMQLSQATFGKRPSYDYIQGANVSPTTFYNIGNLELQDNIARVWVDIGTTEPLLLDVLVNALMQISTDFCGIKQITFGGGELEGWHGSLAAEDGAVEVHKI